MKKDVLEEIVAWKRVELDQCKAILPLSMLARQVERKVVAEAKAALKPRGPRADEGNRRKKQ